MQDVLRGLILVARSGALEFKDKAVDQNVRLLGSVALDAAGSQGTSRHACMQSEVSSRCIKHIRVRAC